MKQQIWIDCDGVLADFDKGFFDIFKMTPEKYRAKHGVTKLWHDLKNVKGGFFNNLPLMEDAKELMSQCMHLRPIILTGCPLGDWAQVQKIKWARKHFRGIPLITCLSRNKYEFAKPGDVLIDDRDKFRNEWERVAHGKFIHHKNAKQSIEELEEFLKNQNHFSELSYTIKENASFEDIFDDLFSFQQAIQDGKIKLVKGID